MVISVILFLILFIVVLFGLFYQLIFLRDPEREIPAGNNIVAPADGKIIKIIKLGGLESVGITKGLIGKIRTLVPSNCKEGYLITIMMNLFNVHVQRSPVDGVVVSIKHTSGSFRNAVYGNKFENGLENEKNEITIENKKLGEIKVIQAAGILARRIQCFVRENQKINKGDRIGRIVMGSQVTLIIPAGINLLVKEGDNVRAGLTIVGNIY